MVGRSYALNIPPHGGECFFDYGYAGAGGTSSRSAKLGEALPKAGPRCLWTYESGFNALRGIKEISARHDASTHWLATETALLRAKADDCDVTITKHCGELIQPVVDICLRERCSPAGFVERFNASQAAKKQRRLVDLELQTLEIKN